MVSRGQVSDDLAYVLLDTPLVPRLDLTDCRPTELPVLQDTTPTQLSDHAPQGQGQGSVGKGGGVLGQRLGLNRPLSADAAGNEERDPLTVLPPAPVPLQRVPVPVRGIKAQIPATEVVRTLIVDMRNLNKVSNEHSNRTDDNDNDEDDTSDEIILEEPAAPRSAKRVGGVLKGGGDYVRSGEQRPRPRVSFLLDAAPGQGQEGGGSMQVRVYAKPPQLPYVDPDEEDESSQTVPSTGGQHFTSASQIQHRFSTRQQMQAEAAMMAELPLKRFRRHGSADRRHSATSYKHQIKQMKAEARLHEAYTAASRSVEGMYRLRPSFYEDTIRTSTPQLPSVPSSSQSSCSSSRRMPLFTFKRKSSMETQVISRRDEHGRRHLLITQNGAPPRHLKGQARFHDDSGIGDRSRNELAHLQSRHVEPRHINAHMGAVGTYSIAEPPPAPPPPPPARVCSKPPLPRSHVVVSVDSVDSTVQPRVTSANTRSGRVREWLSVDSVPNYRQRARPSTVSSASSSTRSRDIHSAQQRLATSTSSRVSSASLKAASDPGADLENMDLVTLNLMARRCKGPSRYRYLAKLKSLNLSTPRPLV